MKNTSLILCILAMMGAISCKNAATTESAAATETAAVAATEGKIVYIDSWSTIWRMTSDL